MRIEYLGNALVQVEHQGRKLLCDPWLTPGALDGAWFHYPPVERRATDLAPTDYLYISHMHLDHFDIATVRELNRDATVIINRDWSPRMEGLLRREGFRTIYALRDRERLQLAPGLWVEMLSSFTDYCPIDSSLFIEWDGFRIMNIVENVATPPALAMLRQDFPEVDVAFLPYSAAGPFPQSFANLTDDEKRAAAVRVGRERMSIFYDLIDALSPRIAVPVAGTYVIGGRNWRLSRFLAIPPRQRVKEMFAAEKVKRGWRTDVVLGKEGSWIEVGRDDWRLDGDEDQFAPDHFERYIESLQDRPYLYERAFLIPKEHEVDLTNLCQVARGKLWRYQHEYGHVFDYNVYFDVGQVEMYALNFSHERIVRVPRGAEVLPYVRCSMAYNHFVMLLNNFTQWDYVQVGGHVEFYRDPEQYNPFVYMMLSFFHV